MGRGDMDTASSAMKPLFALVDCNNFYVSCERVFQPHLRGRPVIVLSNNDGCIISRSQEAKAMGVKMGIPWHEAKPWVASHGLIALSSNYALYGDLSRRVMAILADMAPQQEVYSIDETFLDISTIAEPEALAHTMRQRVLQWTHIPTCVGLGSTKTRAKLANQIAKKSPQYHGVFNLEQLTSEQEQALFARLPVGDIWGVGWHLQEKLARLNIKTVADLCAANVDWLRKQFSVVLARTVWELKGLSCLSLEEIAQPQRQLIHSRSFGQLVTTLDDLEDAILEFVTIAAAKLRQRQLQTAMICVMIQTNPNRSQDAQYRNSISLPLATPTQDTRQLLQQALTGLRQIYRPHYRYKKAGIIMTALSGIQHCQSDWLTASDDERSRSLMTTVDRINQHMGRNVLRWGLPRQVEHWQMRSDMRSPRFTSRWEELRNVKA